MRDVKTAQNAYHPAAYNPRPRILSNQTINIAELVRHYSHIYTNLPSKASQERRIALAKKRAGSAMVTRLSLCFHHRRCHPNIRGKHGNYLVAVMVRIGLDRGFEGNHIRRISSQPISEDTNPSLRCSEYDPDAHLPSDTNHLFASEKGKKEETYRSISL